MRPCGSTFFVYTSRFYVGKARDAQLLRWLKRQKRVCACDTKLYQWALRTATGRRGVTGARNGGRVWSQYRRCVAVAVITSRKVPFPFKERANKKTVARSRTCAAARYPSHLCRPRRRPGEKPVDRVRRRRRRMPLFIAVRALLRCFFAFFFFFSTPPSARAHTFIILLDESENASARTQTRANSRSLSAAGGGGGY